MTDPLTTISLARTVCTGVGLRHVAIDLSPVCNTEHEFDALVTSYYKVYREQISDDVVFLSRVRRRDDVEDFDRILHALRTSKQHSPEPRFMDLRKNWIEEHGSFQACAQALANRFEAALYALAANAYEVSSSPGQANSWKELVSTDNDAILRAVMSDLGLRFSGGRRAWHLRQIEGRLKVDPGHGARVEVVREYAAQQLIAQPSTLPVSYYVVLDHLGLIGDDQAASGLLVAYGVAAIAPNLHADEFLGRVEESWRAAANI